MKLHELFFLEIANLVKLNHYFSPRLFVSRRYILIKLSPYSL